jgi:hypothetical protein
MGDSATTTLRILADASQVTSTFKKVGDEWKVVGDKAVKTTTSLGTTIEGMGKRLLSVAAAIGAITTAASAANEVMDKAEKRARGKNEQSLEAANASLRAGGSQKDNLAFVNSLAPRQRTTQGGRTKFLAAIGDIQSERASRGLPPLDANKIERMEALYNAGGDIVFGSNGSEITNSIKQFPGAPDLAIGRQLAAMNGVAYSSKQDNMALAQGAYEAAQSKSVQIALSQARLHEVTMRKSMDRTGQGQVIIAADEEQEQWELEHPERATLGKKLLPESVYKNEARRARAKDAVEHLKDISDKLGNNAGNPTLPNTSTRGRDPNGAVAP